MKGWRTLAFGLATALLPVGLTYLGGIDWTSYGISPPLAAALGLAIVGLRKITDTPLGKGT